MAQVTPQKVCLSIMIHLLISGDHHPSGPKAEAAGLIRALIPTDVQWGRPVFRAPPLAPLPVVKRSPADPEEYGTIHDSER